MRFMLLLYGDAAAEQSLPAEERTAIVRQHLDFAARLRADGAFVYGDPLDGPDTARVLRPDGIVTDGPFAQAREQLGAVYVVECADLDTAVEYARAVPASPGLSVEVRPVPEY